VGAWGTDCTLSKKLIGGCVNFGLMIKRKLMLMAVEARVTGSCDETDTAAATALSRRRATVLLSVCHILHPLQQTN
jgi:hypothetical protein